MFLFFSEFLAFDGISGFSGLVCLLNFKWNSVFFFIIFCLRVFSDFF